MTQINQNGKDYLSTFKFYDERRRRLSIFAKQGEKDGEKVLDIEVVTCSKKDDFSKKKARMIYEGRIAKPTHTKGEKYTTPITDEKPNYTFINWCKEHYYKYENIRLMLEVYTLMNKDTYLSFDMGAFAKGIITKSDEFKLHKA